MRAIGPPCFDEAEDGTDATTEEDGSEWKLQRRPNPQSDGGEDS